ncbi:MAG: diguanylate cyclase [Desulfobulbaceae bacterium]|nr:diguanylate cyclase [Desulfobulbaceae bacterium]
MYNRPNFLKTFLLLTLIGVVVLPTYIIFYISPQFNKLIVENTELEAVRVANHLVSMFLPDGKIISENAVTKELTKSDKGLRKEFQLRKLKLFLPTGKIIFSSDPEDIGVVNKHSYFFEKVARGENYTKIVKKHDLSLEGQRMQSDVVETYVPIMKDKEFVGAFEVYFDITKALTRLRQLLVHIYVIVGLISGILLFAIVINLLRAKRYEEELRKLSITDGLTGLLNRRGFMALAENQINKAGRIKEELFLLYADIDNMKWINDNLGHSAGDQALVAAANAMRNTFRKSDILSRLGGDEFAALLCCEPGEDSEETILGRLEENLKLVTNPGNSFGFHISTGIVKYSSEGSCTVEELMSRADNLMYENKTRKKSQKVPI